MTENILNVPAPAFDADTLFGMGAKKSLHSVFQRCVQEGMVHLYPSMQARLVQSVITKTYQDRMRQARSGMQAHLQMIRECQSKGVSGSAAGARLAESADWSDLVDTATATVGGAGLSFSSMGVCPSDVAPFLWAGETDVANFRDHRRTDIDSFPDLLEIPEDGEAEDKVEKHPRRWNINTKDFGRSFTHSWQCRLNDDVGLLVQEPQKMAKAATRTMARMMADAMLTNWNSIDGVFMWDTTHANVAANGLTGVNLASAQLLEALIWLMFNQQDQQLDWETGLRNPLPAENWPKYIVTGLNQWTLVWDLLNNDMLPNAAGTLNVPNPLRKYKALGLTPIMFRYLGNSPNVYLFCDKSQYQPAFTYAYLTGANRTPIVQYKDDGWKVVSGSNMIAEFNTYLKLKYRVDHFCMLNTQPWEGTAAIIPAYCARQ